MNGTDDTRFALAKNTCSSSCIWDPRADLDDDGDVDSTDQSLYDTKRTTWNVTTCDGTGPTVAQAFSDVDNPYLFQGVPHFALDTAANDTGGKLMLNHHRARFADPVLGIYLSQFDSVSRMPTVPHQSLILAKVSTRHFQSQMPSRLTNTQMTSIRPYVDLGVHRAPPQVKQIGSYGIEGLRVMRTGPIYSDYSTQPTTWAGSNGFCEWLNVSYNVVRECVWEDGTEDSLTVWHHDFERNCETIRCPCLLPCN